MVLSTAEVASWIGAFYWPFIRIGAMVMSAPVFGAGNVPTRVRLLVAVALTAAIAPGLPQAAAVEPLSSQGLVIALQQLGIGVSIGFAARLVFSAIVLGAHKIALSMGLGFAQLVDPANGIQVPVLGQFYLVLAMLIFVGLNGHLILIEVVAHSFDILPVGMEGIGRSGLWAIVQWGTQLFAGAVLLGLPVVITKMVVLLAFGMVARAAPQLNIFAVGFPVTLLVGFALILLTLPTLTGHVERLFQASLGLMNTVLSGD